MCIKDGPCKDFPVRLRSQENTDVDPFEEIPEDKISLEDVPGLSIDPGDSDEDEDIIGYLNKLLKLLAKSLENIVVIF